MRDGQVISVIRSCEQDVSLSGWSDQQNKEYDTSGTGNAGDDPDSGLGTVAPSGFIKGRNSRRFTPGILVILSPLVRSTVLPGLVWSTGLIRRHVRPRYGDFYSGSKKGR